MDTFVLLLLFSPLAAILWGALWFILWIAVMLATCIYDVIKN